jgi:hypothetical protein
MRPIEFKKTKAGESVAVVPADFSGDSMSWDDVIPFYVDGAEESGVDGFGKKLYRIKKTIKFSKFGKEYDMKINIDADEAVSRYGLQKPIQGIVSVKYAYILKG